MKKLSTLMLAITLLAAGCDNNMPIVANTDNQLGPNETVEGWDVYKNDKHAFQIQHPKDWTQSGPEPILFTFQTSNGYQASLGADSFAPYTFDAGRIAAIQSNPAARTVTVGNEDGLMDPNIVCGAQEANSCSASFVILSNQTTTKGFGFYVTISNLKDVDINRPANIATDPYPLFQSDMKEVETVLRTFKFVQ